MGKGSEVVITRCDWCMAGGRSCTPGKNGRRDEHDGMSTKSDQKPSLVDCISDNLKDLKKATGIKLEVKDVVDANGVVLEREFVVNRSLKSS